jgi:hypothetical protein
MFHGKLIRTRRHPEGTLKRVAVLPVIADLMAIRKVLGFAGVSATNFCSFCNLLRANMDCLEPSYWSPRIGIDVRQAAIEWQQARTKAKRKEIFDKHRVRWSALHRLDYRNPVQHTVLGMMHNWIEGILQHHARVKWGIGGIAPHSSKYQDGNSNEGTPTDTTPSFNVDIDMLDDELRELEAESQAHRDTPSHSKRQHSESSMEDEDGSEIPQEDEEFQPDSPSDSEGENGDVEEERDAARQVTGVFNSEAMSKIHECIANAIVPSWITRPPQNLGDKSHGKLKADQWYTLFTIFLPMVLPELWLASGKHQDSALLDNFHDLVMCTNIIGSYTTSNSIADNYLHHYIRYRRTSETLFPMVATRPNHHYAMHNAELMKFWGPLPLLSEFPFEQHNGTLQKINTNWHICELHMRFMFN